MTADWLIENDLTLEHADAARKQFKALLAVESNPIVIDCAQVAKVDSIGLSTLVSFVRTLGKDKPDAQVRLINVQSMLDKMLAMTRLQSAFPQLVIATG